MHSSLLTRPSSFSFTSSTSYHRTPMVRDTARGTGKQTKQLVAILHQLGRCRESAPSRRLSCLASLNLVRSGAKGFQGQCPLSDKQPATDMDAASAPGPCRLVTKRPFGRVGNACLRAGETMDYLVKISWACLIPYHT